MTSAGDWYGPGGGAGEEWGSGIPEAWHVGAAIPFAEFRNGNACLARPSGCEAIEWIREEFGDPVPVTREFIRAVYDRTRGTHFAAIIAEHAPEATKAVHQRAASEAFDRYKALKRRAEERFTKTGNVAGMDRAIAWAYLRCRGEIFGSLEGAFSPQYHPYW